MILESHLQFLLNLKPFFDPGASSSQSTSGGVSDFSVTGSSLVHATFEVAVFKATQPVEAPGARRGDVIQKNATQPVEAAGAGTATQPVEAPDAGPEILLSGTSSDTAQLYQSLTSRNSQVHLKVRKSKPYSPTAGNFQDGSPDRQDDTNYGETIFHQVPEIDSASSSLDDNPFAGSRVKATRNCK